MSASAMAVTASNGLKIRQQNPHRHLLQRQRQRPGQPPSDSDFFEVFALQIQIFQGPVKSGLVDAKEF